VAREWERQVQAKLVVVAGDERTRQFELHLPAVIGRSRTTDVTLGHPLVSRQHCELYEANGKLMLRDLGSLNGTFVGDIRLCDQPMPIQSGELFTVGAVTLQADYEDVGEPSGEAAWTTSGATVDSPLVEADDNLRFDMPHKPQSSLRRPPNGHE
jgi:predicted component of type VI protein secretion system